jgi:dipeptidyl aminopeptidase/acylaminoacyl peptidase
VSPAEYYVYNRTKGTVSFLFSARPDLAGLPLATMKPVQFKARDGMILHAYLTVPPGVEATSLPAVILVHDGPWLRDDWGFKPEVQWLANRGYACLQINFRGSTGFGKQFLNAGNTEWGGKMQDDLADGARWLVDQGLADPKRIGLYGVSYGGYAVLSGLTKTPGQYACGISVGGIMDLLGFGRSIPSYMIPLLRMFSRRVGDPTTDEDLLKSRSPMNAVDQVRAPLMLVQGANDPQVKKTDVEQFRDRLQKAGRKVEYLEFTDEGRGIGRPENRLKFYAQAEKFLAQYLGGRAEPETP